MSVGQPLGGEDQDDVHRLIALTIGIIKMLTEGMYEPVLEEVVQLQRDWVSKPVDQYTDIQVTLVAYHKKSKDVLIQTSR